ncbi:hypothetical protein ACLOJK_031235 [Asimina triloba]
MNYYSIHHPQPTSVVGIRREEVEGRSKEGNEDEEKESSDGGVLESSNEDGKGDEKELAEDLDTGPRQEPRQSDGQDVVRIWVQQVSPFEVVEYLPSIFLHVINAAVAVAVAAAVASIVWAPPGCSKRQQSDLVSGGGLD